MGECIIWKMNWIPIVAWIEHGNEQKMFRIQEPILHDNLQQSPPCQKISMQIIGLSATMSTSYFFRPTWIISKWCQNFSWLKHLCQYICRIITNFNFQQMNVHFVDNFLNKMKSDINMLGTNMMYLVLWQTTSTLAISKHLYMFLSNTQVINKTRHP